MRALNITERRLMALVLNFHPWVRETRHYNDFVFAGFTVRWHILMQTAQVWCTDDRYKLDTVVLFCEDSYLPKDANFEAQCAINPYR